MATDASPTPSMLTGVKLFVQLFHGGREVISCAPRSVVVSASAIPSHRYHTEPRALTTSDVRDLISSYGHCAAVAAEAGIDGIEITAAHGYLFEQFFNSAYNTRDDEYAEPACVLLDVIDAVRQAAPRLALGVRRSGDSEVAQSVVPRLGGVIDYVHVTTGNSATFDGCVGIVPPLPTPRNVIENFTAPFRIEVPLDRHSPGCRSCLRQRDGPERHRGRHRDEPRPDHRSRHAEQGQGGPRRRDPALHRL